MNTLYDVYKYTEDKLPDFRQQLQPPTQADMTDFARVATEVVESNETTPSSSPLMGMEWDKATFWLPEGIVYVSLGAINDPEFGPNTPERVMVMLDIAKNIGSVGVARQVEIYQSYSRNQKLYRHDNNILSKKILGPGAADSRPYDASFGYFPRVVDYGIDNPDDDAQDPHGIDLVETIELREGVRLEEDGSIQPSSSIDSLDDAEFKSKTLGLVHELALSD